MSALAEACAAYSRSMFIARAPLAVACGYCEQLRGWECRSKTGNRPLGFHAARIAAVAHLTEDEKYTAYAALHAEQEERRKQATEAMARMDANPEYVARRDATRAVVNAAFDEIDRQVRADERRARLEGVAR